MNQEENRRTALSRLDEVKQQFAHWRQTRAKRGPIPEGLWEAAADLVGEYTPYQVVKGLRVNDRELRKRIAKRSDRRQGGGVGPPAQFVEIGLPLPAPGAGGEYTLELEGTSGRRLRLRGTGKLDVAGLVQAFMGISE